MKCTNISHTHTCFKHTTHIDIGIITTMYTKKEIKKGWNDHTNLDDLGLTCCTWERLVINKKTS